MRAQLALAAALALTVTACTQAQPDVAAELGAYGMTDVQTTGYNFFACSKHDTFATNFTARNPQGRRVTGTLCSGWMKGGTVRNLRLAD